MDMMDMDGMDHSMGSMSMGDGMPSLFYLQKMFWAVIGAAIALATTVNIFNRLIHRQRLSAASKNLPTPAKPKNPFLRAYATITATSREISTASTVTPFYLRESALGLPSPGRIIVVLAYLILLLVFSFYRLNAEDHYQWENIGYRTGFMSICQLPLVFLLAGKNNIIGYLAGSSYERLNWLHRWTARGLFVTSTVHMGFFMRSWARYDYILPKMKEDSITQKGMAAWAILVWIVFSSMSPIRGWCYEFFVLQHLVSFAAFIGVVYIHTPEEVRVWIWIPVGLFFFDRLTRLAYVLYTNISIFHPRSKSKGFWACSAELTPLSHHATRITIRDPPIGWTPGQHVLLSCHSVVPLQSHPFTIASIPSDGKMDFLVRSATGGTKRLFRYAEMHHGGLPTHRTEEVALSSNSRAVSIEGPYGRMRPLPQFDSVVFLAGGTGATFTVPLMRDLVRRWQGSSHRIVTRHVRFVWVVKGRGQIAWFAEQLNRAVEDVAALRKEEGLDVEVKMSVYVTCDASLTETEGRGSYASSSSSMANEEAALLGHGKPEALSSAEKDAIDGVKKTDDTVEERAVDDADAIQASKPSGSCCADPATTAGTGCCCTTTVTDETAAAAPACTCNGSSPTASSTRVAPPAPSLIHPAIHLVSGRPSPYNLILPTLEQALGETAVVCCGPAGLETRTRREVVVLSDERAVCKGSGAQAVWYWGEGFGY